MDQSMIRKTDNNPRIVLCKKIQNDNLKSDQKKTMESDHIESEKLFDYILEEAEVNEQQDRLCGKIGLSNTIIYKDERAIKTRVDSRISSISLRPSCDMVRRCDDKSEKSLCELCDNLYANCFLDTKINKLRSNIENQTYRTTPEAEALEQRGIQFAVPEVNFANGIPYITYRCPMLGYIEMMFPICFEGTIIAALIIGQIRRSEEKGTFIGEAKGRFLERNQKMFENYIDKVKESAVYADLQEADQDKYTLKEIADFIMCGDKQPSTPYIDVYDHIGDHHFDGMLIPTLNNTIDKVEFDKIITETCNWVVEFQKKLQEKISSKRSKELKDYFENEQLLFFQRINDKNLNDNNMEILWNNVSTLIKDLYEKCHLQSIVMYSIDEKNKLKIVSYSENYSTNYKTTIKIVEEKLNSLLLLPPVPYDSMTYQESVHDDNYKKLLCEVFSCLPDSDQYVMLFLPRREIPQASIFVVLEKDKDGYADSVMPSLLSGLKNYIILLSAQVATISENSLQNRTKNVFRFYKHETRNLANDFYRSIGYLKDVSNCKPISLYRLPDVAKDAEASLDLFWFLSENFDDKIFDDEPPVFDKKDFNVYELIYKWENVRRHDVHDKNCEIVYEKRTVPFFSDSRYLEIIVYNLISNAVKYSLEGTKIYVDCNTDINNSKRILFSTRNFSFGIPENEKEMIFKNGYRCAMAKKYTPDGSGIGLWLCKKIASYFDGGDIILKENNKISDYNVPLLKKLIENKDYHDLFDQKELALYQEAYDSLREKTIEYCGEKVDPLEHIVSNRGYEKPNIVRRKIRELLKNPTYIVTFEVMLYD